ncbi:MAG: CoA transferase [Deltaproteobacteria bacterium]|nr:MAG: CoA transferase [Deltaproteobacteria bacterium]
MRPLEGLKILDLTRLLPGPYCSLVLADLGADVLKVEAPNGGDYARWMPPLVDGTSALFHALNRGKRSIGLDLKQEAGRRIFERLVEDGWNVVLESFRPGVLARLGLSHDRLTEIDPRTVLVSISGYGQSGPLRERAGHDIDYIALAGVLGFNGPEEGPPVIPGVQIADVAGGSLGAAIGLLAAVHERERTGHGRHVDISMTEGALGLLSMHLAALQAGGPPLRRGAAPLSGAYPCYNVYPTKEGAYMALGALEPHFWQRFCAAVGREDLADRGLDTGEAGAEVRRAVAEIFRSKTQAEWVAFFEAVDCCCEPVLEVDAVFEHPLHRARGVFFDGPAGLKHVRTPVRFTGGDPAPRAEAAPELGAHTDEILEALGIDVAERDRLRAAGVVA